MDYPLFDLELVVEILCSFQYIHFLWLCTQRTEKTNDLLTTISSRLLKIRFNVEISYLIKTNKIVTARREDRDFIFKILLSVIIFVLKLLFG